MKSLFFASHLIELAVQPARRGDLLIELSKYFDEKKKDDEFWREFQIYLELLKNLLTIIPRNDLKNVLKKIAENKDIPWSIMEKILNDSRLKKDEEIAFIILSKYPNVPEEKMLEAIKTGNDELRRKIAERNGLTTKVTSSLVMVGDAIIIKILCRNKNAKIDIGTMELILDKAGEDKDVVANLSQRTDIPKSLQDRVMKLHTKHMVSNVRDLMKRIGCKNPQTPEPITQGETKKVRIALVWEEEIRKKYGYDKIMEKKEKLVQPEQSLEKQENYDEKKLKSKSETEILEAIQEKIKDIGVDELMILIRKEIITKNAAMNILIDMKRSEDLISLISNLTSIKDKSFISGLMYKGSDPKPILMVLKSPEISISSETWKKIVMMRAESLGFETRTITEERMSFVDIDQEQAMIFVERYKKSKFSEEQQDQDQQTMKM